MLFLHFPGGTSGKESTCQCRRYKKWEFNTWVGKILWRRKWQPTPGFLPGESHGQRSLMGYGLRSHKRLDTTDHLSTLNKEGNPAICDNIDGHQRHYAVGNKSNREREILHYLTHVESS